MCIIWFGRLQTWWTSCGAKRFPCSCKLECWIQALGRLVFHDYYCMSCMLCCFVCTGHMCSFYPSYAELFGARSIAVPCWGTLPPFHGSVGFITGRVRQLRLIPLSLLGVWGVSWYLSHRTCLLLARNGADVLANEDIVNLVLHCCINNILRYHYIVDNVLFWHFCGVLGSPVLCNSCGFSMVHCPWLLWLFSDGQRQLPKGPI